ncbi:hypothetical protein ACLK1S_20950 [Escherichia coli]
MKLADAVSGTLIYGRKRHHRFRNDEAFLQQAMKDGAEKVSVHASRYAESGVLSDWFLWRSRNIKTLGLILPPLWGRRG